MRIHHILFISLLFFTSTARAERLQVYLEPFPPLVSEQGQGLINQLFSKIEQISDIRFDIHIATTSRIRENLDNGTADLGGPFALVEEELGLMRNAVIPLKIKFLVKNDIYSTKEINTNIQHFKTLKRVGVPFGDEAFVAQLVGISAQQVHLQKLDNLCLMLAKGRIDALAFERGAAMSCIQKFQLENIYYRRHPIDDIPVGLVISDTIRGAKIKEKLDRLIETIDMKEALKRYYYFLNLPDHGTVPLSPPTY